MNAPGKTLLKVCGILFIIAGAFSVIGSLGSIAIVGSWDSLPVSVLQVYEQSNITKSSLTISIVLAVIQAVLFLVAGILGVKNCNRPEKAQGCMILAILCLVLVLGSAVYSAMSGQLIIWSTLIWLVIPLLYLWGALKNKQAEK